MYTNLTSDFVQYFSKNNLPTIITKNNKDQDKLGNRITLSKYDIKLANTMYHCPGKRINLSWVWLSMLSM